MLAGQLDRCIVKETTCGNRRPLSNQSSTGGTFMATSNANKLFSEFKSAKDFDAAVEEEIQRGVTPRGVHILKKDSTVHEWASKKLYARNLAAVPANREIKRLSGRQYYQDNKERIGKKNRKWHSDNKDRSSELRRTWYRANREHALEQGRRYERENKEKIAERKRKYREANKDKIAEQKKRVPRSQ